MAASHTHRKSSVDVAMNALRETMFHARQNRTADPFLVDHLLNKHGQTDEKSATNFVNKYNAQVFFDPTLMLQEKAAKRQASFKHVGNYESILGLGFFQFHRQWTRVGNLVRLVGFAASLRFRCGLQNSELFGALPGLVWP